MYIAKFRLLKESNMAIKFHEQTRTFHLYNKDVSYIMRVMENEQLENLYYGKVVHDKEDSINGSIGDGCLKLCWTPDGNTYGWIAGGAMCFHAAFKRTDLFELVQKGVVGNLIEIESADGDTINIFVE